MNQSAKTGVRQAEKCILLLILVCSLKVSLIYSGKDHQTREKSNQSVSRFNFN